MAPTGPGTRTKRPVGARRRRRGAEGGGGGRHDETSPGVGGGPQMPGAGMTPGSERGDGGCIVCRPRRFSAPGHVPLANPIVRGVLHLLGLRAVLAPRDRSRKMFNLPVPASVASSGVGTANPGWGPGWAEDGGLWLGWRCHPRWVLGGSEVDGREAQPGVTIYQLGSAPYPAPGKPGPRW